MKRLRDMNYKERQTIIEEYSSSPRNIKCSECRRRKALNTYRLEQKAWEKKQYG